MSGPSDVSGSHKESAGSTSGSLSHVTDARFSSTNINNNSSNVSLPGSKYVEDSDVVYRHFYFSGQFEAEFCRERPRPSGVGAKCDKNPGHFCYRRPGEMSEVTLPEPVRCHQVAQFLSLAAELTVRVVVGNTSAARGQVQESQDKFRTGTGSAIIEPLFNDAENGMLAEGTSAATFPPEDATTAQGRTSKILRQSLAKATAKAARMYAARQKKKKIAIYVETNRHIVFDNYEAEHTIVEFFFDQADRKSVRSLKVSRVLHDASIDGGNRSLLVCRTSDHSFAQTLAAKRRELEQMVAQFPSAVREGLLKHVFIIHHPHGAEKVYSAGKCAVRKYVVEPPPQTSSGVDPRSRSAPRLTKITDVKQIPQDVSTMRKVLVHTADTCRGSSGAPVIAFTATGRDASGTPDLALRLWMHEGREVNGPLNVSVMEACTAADLTSKRSEPRPLSPLPPLSLPGPVVRMTSPTHYVYSTLRKRVESFAGVPPHTLSHSVHELARGGFFYAGYSDCVRCFYCGVGIKQWFPTDDIYAEHRRLRPDCHFLVLQLRAMGATISASGAPSHHAPASPPQSPVPLAIPQPVPAASMPSLDCHVTPSCPETPKPGLATGAAADWASHAFFPSQSQREIVAYPVTEIIYGKYSTESTKSTENSSNNFEPVPPRRIDFQTSAEDGRARLMIDLLQAENAILERPLTCKVCSSAPVREIYLPCGHLDSCSECTPSINTCPTCCSQIKATVKIWFA